MPKFDLNLDPLKYDLPLNEILRHLKDNNKFLFEETNDEKNINEVLKGFQINVVEKWNIIYINFHKFI